jgi:hypothetical protein
VVAETDLITQSVQLLAQSIHDAHDEATIRTALQQVCTLQQWVDNCKVALTRKLQVLATTTPRIQPQQVLASAANISRIDAFREVSRAKTLGAFPQLEHAFEQGRIGSAHIDAVARATHQLTEDEKAKLASRSDWLNNVATHATPDNFARAVVVWAEWHKVVHICRAVITPVGNVVWLTLGNRNLAIGNRTVRIHGFDCFALIARCQS